MWAGIEARTLRRAGVPDELIAWIGDETNSDDTFDACERPDWLIWLAAIDAVDLDALLEATAQCVRTAVVHVAKHGPVKGAEELRRAFRSVCRAQDSEAYERALQACTALGGEAPQNYRVNPVSGYAHAASAVTWLARARESLDSARAVDEGQRLNRGLELAGMIGVPPTLMTPGREGKVRFNSRPVAYDLIWDQIAMSVASAAKAARSTTLTRASFAAPDIAERTAVRRAERHLGDRIHDVLGPTARRGTAARAHDVTAR